MGRALLGGEKVEGLTKFKISIYYKYWLRGKLIIMTTKNIIRVKLKELFKGFRHCWPASPEVKKIALFYCEPVLRVSSCLSGAGSFLLKGEKK